MSDSDEWCTPTWITEALPLVDLDPCSNALSTVRARRTIARPGDGLALPWGRVTIFTNPPYSDVTPWLHSAIACAWFGGEVLMLPKLDPTTSWSKTAKRSGVLHGDRPWEFSNRIKFAKPGKDQVANFPSALMLFSRKPLDRSAFGPVITRWLAAGVIQ